MTGSNRTWELAARRVTSWVQRFCEVWMDMRRSRAARGSGRGGAAAGMAAARRTTTISAALDIASTQPVSLD